MKKKYITLEEVLKLRGTDTKIYDDCLEKWYYYQFKDGLLCLMKDGNIDVLCERVYSNKLYILEPEEFKVEKTGKYKTRDGRIAYVARIKRSRGIGMIESIDCLYVWEEDGKPSSYGCTLATTDQDDLVEYVGD